MVLWQEVQTITGMSAATCKAGFAYYYPALHALGVDVVYDASGGAGEAAWASWFPSGSCDVVAADLYCTAYDSGTTLATLASLAAQSSPPLPVGIGELGNSASGGTPTTAQLTAYLSYVTTFLTGRLAAGLPVSDVMWYNGDPSAAPPHPNTITGPTDPRAALLKTLWQEVMGAQPGNTLMTAAQTATVTLAPKDDHGDVTGDTISWAFTGPVTTTIAPGGRTATVKPASAAAAVAAVTASDTSSPKVKPFTAQLAVGATPGSRLAAAITVNP